MPKKNAPNDCDGGDVDNETNGSCRARAKNVLIYYEFRKCKWNDILSARLLYPISHLTLYCAEILTEKKIWREFNAAAESRVSCDCYLAWKSVSNDSNADDIRLFVDVDAYGRSFVRRRAQYISFCQAFEFTYAFCVFSFFGDFPPSPSPPLAGELLRWQLTRTHTHHTAHISIIPNIFFY